MCCEWVIEWLLRTVRFQRPLSELLIRLSGRLSTYKYPRSFDVKSISSVTREGFFFFSIYFTRMAR